MTFSNAPTMEDIARRAGVHRATVSNVLNGRLKSQRSDAARRAEQIRQIAQEMGYRPSQAARATRTGRTGFIGMIRSQSLHMSVHNPEFDSGIDEALYQRGFCLVRDIIGDDATSVPRIVEENVVDGLLINYAFGTPPPVRDLLDRCKIPAVWINRERDSNCVRPADEGAAFEATEELLRFGHHDIALLMVRNQTPPYEIHYSEKAREDGFSRAMQRAGLKPRIDHLIAPPASTETRKRGWLLKACVAYLQRADRPSAVLCNFNGRTMLHAAEVARLSVPKDLSVIAFDTEAAADERTAVDRLLVPHVPMGRAAVEEACALIDNPTRSRPPVIIPFEYHRTGTVGPHSISRS